jgi:hypothetical protein
MLPTVDTTEAMPEPGIATQQNWQPMVVSDSLPEGKASPRTPTPTEEGTTDAAAYTAEEEALVEERLKNLGYL